jgi:hypothetical protein
MNQIGKGYVFLAGGWGAIVTSLAGINWEFLNAMSGTALHGLGVISFFIGLLIKWPDIMKRIRSIKNQIFK